MHLLAHAVRRAPLQAQKVSHGALAYFTTTDASRSN